MYYRLSCTNMLLCLRRKCDGVKFAMIFFVQERFQIHNGGTERYTTDLSIGKLALIPIRILNAGLLRQQRATVDKSKIFFIKWKNGFFV